MSCWRRTGEIAPRGEEIGAQFSYVLDPAKRFNAGGRETSPRPVGSRNDLAVAEWNNSARGGGTEAATRVLNARLADEGLVLVEGQGSLCHPASTATLPLLRGSQATDLLLVHRANQNCIQRLPQITLPPLQELVASNYTTRQLRGAGFEAKELLS